MAAPPKSILKKPKARPAASGSDDDEADSERPNPLDRRREIALQHARIIQHRKDLEAQILDDLVLLSEYPPETSTKGGFTSARPSPDDAAAFRRHVRLFQPSDYDDLIVERNVNGLCGYTLCGRPRRQTGPGGEWKIMASGQIARRKDIEMWCSNACARRAMYVKVQLNETAAWERAGIPDIEIELLQEDKPAESEADRTARRLGELKLEDQRQAATQSAALALERGDEPPQPGVGETFVVTLREKPTTAAPETGVFEDDEDDHMMVEGYRSKAIADKVMGGMDT